MSKPYTLQELLVIAVAKEIRDHENVILTRRGDSYGSVQAHQRHGRLLG